MSRSSRSAAKNLFKISILSPAQRQHCINTYFPKIAEKCDVEVMRDVRGDLREMLKNMKKNGTQEESTRDLVQGGITEGSISENSASESVQEQPSGESILPASTPASRRQRRGKKNTPDALPPLKLPRILQEQLEKQQEQHRSGLEHANFDLSLFTESDFPVTSSSAAYSTSNPLLSTQIKHPFFDTHFHIFYLLRQFELHRLDLLELRQMIWTKNYWRQNAVPCICRFTDTTRSQFHSQSWEDVFEEARFWPMYGVFGATPEFAPFYTKAMHQKVLRNLQQERCVGVGDLGLVYEFRVEEELNVSGNVVETPDIPLEKTEEDDQSANKVPPEQRKMQREVLTRLLQMAVKHEKSISLRPPQTTKESQDLMQILLDHVPRDWRIHVHPVRSQTYAPFIHQIQQEFSEVYFGLNAELLAGITPEFEALIRSIPLERVMLGSDSPLSSNLVTNAVQYGALQIVTPAHVPLMARALGKIYSSDGPGGEISPTKVGLVTRENVKRVYGI